MTSPEPNMPIWRTVLPPFLLAMVLWATFILKLHNLDHSGITRWDEAFHAVVAQNVMKHPLKPTLIDHPYLPFDYQKWGENHVWLHKPILPFWQVALSLALFGVNTFALRLPAALLSTAAAGITYLIGRELFDRRTALVAATLQATNPFVVSLVHGYQFADNIDIALLFWVEVGVYFLARSLRTASWRDVLLAGVAQGLAFLSKSYLAGILIGLALTACLLPLCRLTERDTCRIGPARLFSMLGMTLFTVAPWMVYCAIVFPDEFAHEHGMVWQHLYTNVEHWAAPWDRVAFDYLIAIYGVFYTPILVAAIVLIGKAFAQRHTGLWLMVAWSLGVLLPHLFAVTKTPSATLIAMPALFLLLGCLVADASRGQRWPLAALTAILFMSIVIPAVVKNPGHGYPNPRVFAGVMLKALWVVYHVGGALHIFVLISAATSIVRLLAGSKADPAGLWIRRAAQLFCLGVLLWLGILTLLAAWSVTNIGVDDPFSVEVGQFARDNLPANAVLLCEERKAGEHLNIMFYADRTCYALDRTGANDMARRVVQAGGIPYIVARRSLAFQRVFSGRNGGGIVHQWR